MDKRLTTIDRIKARTMSAEEFDFDNLVAPPLVSMIPIDAMIAVSKCISYPKSSNPMKVEKEVNKILNPLGFRRIGGGTNRVCYGCDYNPNIVLKVAMTSLLFTDSPREFKNQFKFKPFVSKCFECSPDGCMGLFERVIPITSREEFSSVAKEIKYLMDNWFIGKYVFTDVGTHYFMNWGVRKGFGPVLLDYPYCYEIDPNKLICDRPQRDSNGKQIGICGGIVDYDPGYNALYCTKCGKKFTARDIGKPEELLDEMHYGDKKNGFVRNSKASRVSAYASRDGKIVKCSRPDVIIGSEVKEANTMYETKKMKAKEKEKQIMYANERFKITKSNFGMDFEKAYYIKHPHVKKNADGDVVDKYDNIYNDRGVIVTLVKDPIEAYFEENPSQRPTSGDYSEPGRDEWEPFGGENEKYDAPRNSYAQPTRYNRQNQPYANNDRSNFENSIGMVSSNNNRNVYSSNGYRPRVVASAGYVDKATGKMRITAGVGAEEHREVPVKKQYEQKVVKEAPVSQNTYADKTVVSQPIVQQPVEHHDHVTRDAIANLTDKVDMLTDSWIELHHDEFAKDSNGNLVKKPVEAPITVDDLSAILGKMMESFDSIIKIQEDKIDSLNEKMDNLLSGNIIIADADDDEYARAVPDNSNKESLSTGEKGLIPGLFFEGDITPTDRIKELELENDTKSAECMKLKKELAALKDQNDTRSAAPVDDSRVADLSKELNEVKAKNEELSKKYDTVSGNLSNVKKSNIELQKSKDDLVAQDKSLKKSIKEANMKIKESESKDEEIKSLTADYEKASADISKVEEENETLKKQIKELEAYKSVVSVQSNNMKTEIDATNTEMEKLQHQLETVSAERDDAINKLQALKETTDGTVKPIKTATGVLRLNAKIYTINTLYTRLKLKNPTAEKDEGKIIIGIINTDGKLLKNNDGEVIAIETLRNINISKIDFNVNKVLLDNEISKENEQAKANSKKKAEVVVEEQKEE